MRFKKQRFINNHYYIVNMRNPFSHLESIVKIGGKLAKVAAAITLPFIFTNVAKAVEGYVTVYSSTSGIAGSHFNIAHRPDGTSGLDANDDAWKYTSHPSGLNGKSVSVVEGVELWAQSESSYGEPSGTSVSHSLVLGPNAVLTIDEPGASYSITASSSGYDGYRILCDGDEASSYNETGTISAGTYHGPTEIYLESTSISFSKITPTITYTSPGVETFPVVVQDVNATFTGKLTYDGVEGENESCSYRFSYRPSGGSFTSTNWECCVNEGNTFSATVSNLQPNTLYFVQAEARNSEYSDQGGLERFLTLSSGIIEPNDSDANSPPIALDSHSQTLIIQNFVKQFEDVNNPHKNQGNFVYTEITGASPLIDANDKFYTQISDPEAKVVSLIENGNDFYELSTHVTNPEDSEGALLEFSIASSGSLTINSENYIKFWVSKPDNLGEMFNATLQEINVNDPNTAHPLHDVKKYVSKEQNLKLENISTPHAMAESNSKMINLNQGYLFLELSTKKKIGDFDGNGKVDMDDYQTLTGDLGKTGAYLTDIAGSEPNLAPQTGMPDGKVEVNDLVDFARLWTAENEGMFPSNPGIIEDFEGKYSNGGFQPYWTNGNNGTVPWKVDDKYSQSGKFSARSGEIGNNETSSMNLTVNLDRSGTVSYWRKVSSEPDFDTFKFSINGQTQEVVAGERGWEYISFPVSQGTNELGWEYNKDFLASKGLDSVWIDDVQVIPNEYEYSSPVKYLNSGFLSPWPFLRQAVQECRLPQSAFGLLRNGIFLIDPSASSG